VELELDVDGKDLGYHICVGSLEEQESKTYGLYSYDAGISKSSDRALIFAKAKVFNWSNSDQEA
jgi:hypothetical protein